jgi:RNA polymerase sigma-70 factor, ECF subfamily
MEIQVEKQLMEDLKTEPAQFIALYDEYFSEIYRYVARRVSEQDVLREIVNLVFLDAYGQRTTAPTDVGFKVWLFGLAWQRVRSYVEKSVSGPGAPVNSPVFEGASLSDGVYDDEFKLKQQADTFFSSLTAAEREVVRLKFFEEVTDGELKYVLGIEKGLIGPTIYRVLKRGYEILFGKSEDNRGVYYGELHSFLSRLRKIEKIPSPDGLKLEVKLELQQRIGGVAPEAEPFSNEAATTAAAEAEGTTGVESGIGRSGSDDPAKIFVNAAKGMSRDEVDHVTREYVAEREAAREPEASEELVGVGRGAEAFVPETAAVEDVPMGMVDVPGFEELKIPVDEIQEEALAAGKIEDIPVEHYEYDDGGYDEPLSELRERVMDSWERWKYYFSIIPTVLLGLAVIIVVSAVLFGRVENESVTGLAFDIDYQEGFAEWDEPVEELPDYERRVVIENDLVKKVIGRKKVELVEVNLVYPARVASRLNLDFDLVNGEGLEYEFDVLAGDDYKVRSVKKNVSE